MRLPAPILFALPLLFSLVVGAPSPQHPRLPNPALHRRDSNNDAKPTPTLPFTLAAFQSPWPPGYNGSGSYGVSGLRVRAFGGSLWVNPVEQVPRTECGTLAGRKCPPGNETVVWVDEGGRAWLDSSPPQPLYLNTQTGVLSYFSTGSSSFPPGAIKTNFLHLGSGTAVTVPIPNIPPPYVNAGPGSFNWIGSVNDYWFLCPRPGPGYQVMKFVGGLENWDACLGGIQLVALDYAGVSPAAGVYD